MEFCKRERSHPEDALVLEPSSGWHRYIVHQAVQLFPSLSSFSVGEGAKRRPVICFSSKFGVDARNLQGEDTVESKDERRPHRRLYVPPASRSGNTPTNQTTEIRTTKKNNDERLQGQLQSRIKLFEEEEEFSQNNRVPELNPHAASFVPFSSDVLSNHSFQSSNNPPQCPHPVPPSAPPQQSFIRNQTRIGNDISNAPQNNFNTIQDNHFNPEAQPFVPVISNGVENLSLFDLNGHLNGSNEPEMDQLEPEVRS